MDRVGFPEGPNPFASPLLPKKGGEEKKVGKGKGLFRTVLGNAIEETRSGAGTGGLAAEPYSEADIGRLLDEVHESGDRLKENPSVDLVQAYKRAVRDFVHYVVERSYSLEEKSSGGSILKRKKYIRLAVIDESLERLAAEILRNQRDRLEILRRVDEINGMLVDLLR